MPGELEQEIEGRGVTLYPQGRFRKARCPFHEERTPSFNVDPVKQKFHCFGCGAEGDARDFRAIWERKYGDG